MWLAGTPTTPRPPNRAAGKGQHMIKKLDAKKVHERQQKYVDSITQLGFDFGLVVAQTFIESMRSLGYKSTGTAINELIDNAGEAGAENVHVCFGYEGTSRKPAKLAVIDDGIGM